MKTASKNATMKTPRKAAAARDWDLRENAMAQEMARHRFGMVNANEDIFDMRRREYVIAVECLP